MPRRKQDEPQIFPGVTVSEDAPPAMVDQNAHVYLTDSTEMNRIRASLSVGAMIETRALFTARELTPNEERMFRNGEALAGIAVHPAHVDCTMTAPGSAPIDLNVIQRDGVYVAEIVVGRRGGWYYRFTGHGGWVGERSRVFDIT